MSIVSFWSAGKRETGGIKMSIISILLQILLTIPLTIILNFLSKKETRQIDKIVIPTIYIFLLFFHNNKGC